MVSRIERGEVHASAVVLDKLCAGLDLTLSALFAREAASPLLRAMPTSPSGATRKAATFVAK
ncbi:MAG: hypothetical protein WDN06_21670 [Asticcacaulis sp.]